MMRNAFGIPSAAPKADLWSAERITGLWKESRLIRKSEGWKMYIYICICRPICTMCFEKLQMFAIQHASWSSMESVKICQNHGKSMCIDLTDMSCPWYKRPTISICTKKHGVKYQKPSTSSLLIYSFVCLGAWIVYTGLCACLKTQDTCKSFSLMYATRVENRYPLGVNSIGNLCVIYEAIESNLSYIRPSEFISKFWSKIHFTPRFGVGTPVFRMAQTLRQNAPSQKAAEPWSLFGIERSNQDHNSLHEFFRVSLFRISTGPKNQFHGI